MPNPLLGGKFGDLRHVRHYSERICFVTSIVVNSVLIVLLAKEKNAVMKPYSRVLLLNAVCDYIYTIVSIITEVVS